MLQQIFCCIKRGLYCVDLTLFDSAVFGPEYSVLHQQIRKSLVSGHYYRHVPGMEAEYD